MYKTNNIKLISDLAASQWGLFTTAQAEAQGVSRNVIAHMLKTGKVERLEQGVYHLCGAPSDSLMGIRASWMTTNPLIPTYERLHVWDGVVIGGQSAAAIHEVGDFYLTPYHFLTSKRFNSKKTGVEFSLRPVDKQDVMIVSGLPVTTVERTILDLCKDSTDPSLISDALNDVVEKTGKLNYSRLLELFDEESKKRRGLPRETIHRIFNEAGLTLLPLSNLGAYESDVENANKNRTVFINEEGALITADSIAPLIEYRKNRPRFRRNHKQSVLDSREA